MIKTKVKGYNVQNFRLQRELLFYTFLINVKAIQIRRVIAHNDGGVSSAQHDFHPTVNIQFFSARF